MGWRCPVSYILGAIAASPVVRKRLIFGELENEWTGRFRLEKIDAELEPEKARQYQVMTLPTTIMVDTSGAIKHINYGLTSTRNLARQLEEMT